MIAIRRIPVPTDTVLEKYSAITGAYTDCYITEIPRMVSFAEFVFAFYTTPLFKLERFILKFTVSKPSTDLQARQIAEGNIESFAAWRMEARTENELMMCDFLSRTRSWFMTIPMEDSRTRSYFGSAVLPKSGKTALEFGFQAMLGFHQIYSVLLLYSAKGKLEREGMAFSKSKLFQRELRQLAKFAYSRHSRSMGLVLSSDFEKTLSARVGCLAKSILATYNETIHSLAKQKGHAPMLNLNSVMIGTKQPKELAAFYEKVLGKPADMMDAEHGFWGWQVGGAFMSVLDHSEMGGGAKDPGRVMINFETEQVQEEFERIKSIGGKVIKEPYDMGGGWIATLADPDGNYFQLISPMVGQ